jgi:hypothetical protein
MALHEQKIDLKREGAAAKLVLQQEEMQLRREELEVRRQEAENKKEELRMFFEMHKK